MIKMDGLILAGGGNTRMGGFFKGDLPAVLEETPLQIRRFSGQTGSCVSRTDYLPEASGQRETFLSRLIREMQPQVSELWISRGSAPEDDMPPALRSSRPAEENYPGCRIVYDSRPDCGPLCGLHAGLSACREEWIAVAACDMPYLKWDLYRYLADILSSGDPESPENPEASRSSPAECHSEMYTPVSSVPDGIVPVFKGRRHPLAAIYHRRAAAVFKSCLDSGRFGIQDALGHLRIRCADLDSRPGLAAMLVNINTWEDYRRLGGKKP